MTKYLVTIAIFLMAFSISEERFENGRNVAGFVDKYIWVKNFTKNQIENGLEKVRFLRSKYEQINKRFKLKSKGRDFLSQVIHGHGASISPSLEAFAGGELTYEIVIHDNKLAIFCAPGVMIGNELGLGVGVDLIKTINCESNKSYSGKFLTFFGSILFTTLLKVPVSIGFSYNIGLNIHDFLLNLVEYKKSGEFDIHKINYELGVLFKTPIKNFNRLSGKHKRQIILSQIVIGQFVTSLLHLPNPVGRIPTLNMDSTNKINLKQLRSIREHLDTIIEIIKEFEVPNLKLLLDEFNKHITGCSSYSVDGSLSASLFTISAGIKVHHYTLIEEFDLGDIIYLSNISPLKILKLGVSLKERKKLRETLDRVLPKIKKLSLISYLSESTEVFVEDIELVNELIE